MAYIGNGPGTIRQGRRAVYEFTSTANQTAFSGTDENGLTLDLLQANDNDVYLNGVRLIITDDYTISGDVLTLTSGAASGDKLIIMTQDEIANDASYSKAASDSRYINYDGDIVNGTIQIGGSGNNITFADNNKAIFGDGSDLQIYHDGNDKIVSSSSYFILEGSNIILRNNGGTEDYAKFFGNGAVNLYHDNSLKLATTSTGIDVTGTVSTTGIYNSGIYNQTGDAQFWVTNVGEAVRIQQNTGNVGIGTNNPGRKLTIAGGNDAKISFTGGGTQSLYFGDGTGAAEYAGYIHYAHADDNMRFQTTGDFTFRGGDVTVEGTTKAEQYLLDAIAKDISDTAVDVFIYDTRKDSDGGAWRKRTQNTSWYNETLNTATRGARKEFPAVAVIVAESTQVTIYDGDDPDMPMWMVFPSDTGGAGWIRYINVHYSGTTITRVNALNGIMPISVGNSAFGGVVTADFISDNGTVLYAGINEKRFIGSIIDRNSIYATYDISTRQIVNRQVNDVAMTVLPNAPIDSATGLPVPTIAVGTNGGVSVIKDDGTVVDIVTSYLGHETPKQVRIIGDRVFWLGQNNYDDGWSSTFTAKIPSADVSVNYNTGVGALTKYTSFEWGTASFRSTNGSDILIPIAMGSPRTSLLLETGKNDELILGGKGADDHGTVVKIEENLSDPESGMIAQIASDFATGYQVGDIKLATLSDTDDTNITGAELVTNGTFDSNTTGWSADGSGDITFSSVGSTLQVVRGTNVAGAAYQGVTVEVGKVYTFSANITSGTMSVRVGTAISGTQYKDLNTQTGSMSCTFTATSTTVYITMWPQSPNTTANIDNVSVRLAEEDRSVNGEGLQVFGTVTKTAVATGADLMAYSGFSSGNYLRQPYNSDLNFGTGDWAINCWFKITAATNTTVMLSWRNVGGQTPFWQVYQTNTTINFDLSDGTGGGMSISTTYRDDQWHMLTFLARGPSLREAWIDGKLIGSNTTTLSTGVTGGASHELRVGTHFDGLYPYTGSLALLRISATAPSAEQIKKIYEDEKHLFQENAKATLYGSSDAVTALAYDDDTELLHVGTSAGRSVFQGLRRIDNTTDAVGAAISASNGMVAED